MSWKEKYHSFRRFVAPWQFTILGLALFTLVLKSAARSFPELIQQYYTDGFYNVVRWIFDILTGWLPVAFIYIVGIALIAGLFKAFLNWKKIRTIRGKIISAFIGVLVLGGGLYTSFTWLWGFNYEKTSFVKTHDLEPVAFNDSLLIEELKDLANQVVELRQTTGFTDSVTIAQIPKSLDEQVRKTLNNGLIQMGYQPKGKLRAKMLYPKGSLLRISTAGVFLPFSGEGHIDPGLHPLQIPFVMAHEMSHAQGFTDEGVANFVAFFVLSQSSDAKLKYCGLLGYFRYLASQCRRIDPEWYAGFFKNLNPKLRSDLIDIATNARKYPDILPKLRDMTYDRYLKAQGIKDGLRSYSTIVKLKHQWERRYGLSLTREN